MSLKSLSRSASKVSGNVPLRVILVVPFVLQILGAVGLVGWLSLRNGQHAINDVTTQLRSEISARIQQHFHNYLATPLLINQLNVDAIRLGQLDVKNERELERHFFRQAQRFPGVGYIYFGNNHGEFIGVARLDDGTLQIQVSDKTTNGKGHRYATNAQGDRTKRLRITSTSFDSRKRPWYKNAAQTGKPTWSEIYPFFSEPKLTITASQPIYTKNGVLDGVIASDLIVSQVSEFLRSLKIGKRGQTFIIERSGLLVASSTPEPPFSINKGATQRLKATDSSNALTRATAKYLTSHFGTLSNIATSQQLAFDINRNRQFVQVTPISEVRGLDWLIVVVVPESDFMERIDANTRTTILLCLAALVLATLIGVITSRWIVQPIWRLSTAADALSKGQWNNTVKAERSYELGVLANAFNSMASQLQESFTTLEAKNTELQQFDKLKDEFLANTSHELRTPLNGIIGIADSLIDGAAGELPEKAIANLAMIVSSGRRLSNLVNDILDFSKLKHKNIELQIKRVGVREIADVVLTISQPLIGQKSLQLINSISSDIPLVDADENRLQQIFYNLIGNAIKFTESGTILVSAEVVGAQSERLKVEDSNLQPTLPFGNGYTEQEGLRSTTLQGQIAITVADTGMGIPADKLERIFESFEQADGSTAREYGGTGLGLAITKQLVELHGGEIRASSRVGEGSQFTFTLPLSQNQAQGNSEISPLRSIAPSLELPDETLIAAEGYRAESGEFKILIVDDEPINLQVLANNLSLEHYAITQATNGLEALTLIESGFQPDLILLDVMMPRMTGYEVCKKLRERFLAIELPIVMLTAKNQTSDLVEGFISGANDYLTKPFSKNELLARIKTHIRLAKINAAYGRFVPHDFLRFLGHESIVDVKLGDHVQKDLTILFADIRDFTTLSEGMTPEENFNFINSYLSRVSPVIRAHNGFIDKYIGDAVMALFPESVDKAISGAIEMQKQVILYNEHRQNNGYLPIAIGIGLHTGSLMLGTIGSQERMESTVIADAVNLASRLEGLTKLYGAGILISGQTLGYLDDSHNYSYRFVDRVRVKGKQAPVAIFEVYEGDEELLKQLKTQTKTSFEQAVLLYSQQQFAQAQQIFQEILQINTQDKAAILYIKRCEKYQKYGVPEEWEGVEALTEK
jgi:two-component system sensor histidine kinase ChiS